MEITSFSDPEIDEKIKTSIIRDRGNLTVIVALQQYQTASLPSQVTCSDSTYYVIKSPKDKQAVTDSIVGFLGGKIGVPIGRTGFATLDRALIDAYPDKLKGHLAGIVHTSEFIDGADFLHAVPPRGEGLNRPRMALFGILYALFAGNDPQFMIEVAGDRLIYSHDHGHFLGNGTWDTNTLAEMPPVAFPAAFSTWGISDEEQREACGSLENIDDEDILAAVSMPPADWPITIVERRELAKVIAKRRKDLLDFYKIQGNKK